LVTHNVLQNKNKRCKIHTEKASCTKSNKFIFIVFFSDLPDWPGIAVFLQNALIFFR